MSYARIYQASEPKINIPTSSHKFSQILLVYITYNMLQKMIKTSILLPILFLVVGWIIVGYESYQSLVLETGWVRSEFYFTSLLNFVFIFTLTTILHFCLRSKSLVQRYLMSIGIVSSLIFYWYASLSYDPAFPTLAALLLVSILFIIPSLLLLKLVTFLIEKYQAKNKSLL